MSVSIGHFWLRVKDVSASERFYVLLGLELVERLRNVTVLGARGHSHVCLQKSLTTQPRRLPIDFMVDNLEETLSVFKQAGFAPSQIERDRESDHRSFVVKDPDGHEVEVISSHIPIPQAVE